MKNFDIRDMIEKSGFRHWEVAQQMGVDATTLCRWLRTDLTPERERRIITAITELKNPPVGRDSEHTIEDLGDGYTLHRFKNHGGVPYSAIYQPDGMELFSCERPRERGMMRCFEEMRQEEE